MMNNKFRGGLLGLKDFKMILRVTAAQLRNQSRLGSTSLLSLEKEHTKSVYLRNEEDKKRGIEYVMSKILGFYKECLELGPEYLTRMEDEGEVTYLAFGGNIRNLGSFGEETKKTTNLHQHLLRISTQKLVTASQITRNAVTTHLKTASQDLQMALDCLRKPAFVCIAVDMSRKTRLCRKDTIGPPMKGVGLRVVDSHTGNHPEDDFTPPETIQRPYSDVKVIIPKRSQAILDTLLGYVSLYTHHFSLSNLRLPIPTFICKVLNYFKAHISRINPFDMVKLITFVVMCKAYGGGVDVPKALHNPITHLGNWKGSFFFIENKIIPFGYPELLLGKNKLDKKSFKDKVPLHPEMDPLSFILGEVDGELNFLLAKGASKG
ncbi:hypothetical protein Tco_0248304 [Tanacetum coccineum]